MVPNSLGVKGRLKSEPDKPEHLIQILVEEVHVIPGYHVNPARSRHDALPRTLRVKMAQGSLRGDDARGHALEARRDIATEHDEHADADLDGPVQLSRIVHVEG